MLKKEISEDKFDRKLYIDTNRNVLRLRNLQTIFEINDKFKISKKKQKMYD